MMNFIHYNLLKQSILIRYIHCFRFLCSLASKSSNDPEDLCDSITKNEIAVEAISERLYEITALAEELDSTLQSAQQDCLVFTSISTSTSSLSGHISPETLRKEMENPPTNLSEVSNNNILRMHGKRQFYYFYNSVLGKIEFSDL